MAKTKSKAETKASAAAPKRRGRPPGKATHKKKTVRRKRAARSSVNISRVTAELTRAGVPAASISALLSDIKKQGKREDLTKQREKLQLQVDKLTAKVSKIDAQIAALDGKKSGPKRVANVAAPGKRRKRRGRPAGVKADAVLDVLKKAAGKSLLRADVAAALGVDSSKVGPTLASLLADGKIKRKGERRGTRYSM
ncbi:MAG: hypothetical protein O2923_00760 [Verrucomicrobia bacterium]|nr:hypothetical protein [Verrucomicrobiota bacterium]MDA1085986.1 hypothetical protein [Verrucomicrobiota bacterium]